MKRKKKENSMKITKAPEAATPFPHQHKQSEPGRQLHRVQPGPLCRAPAPHAHAPAAGRIPSRPRGHGRLQPPQQCSTTARVTAAAERVFRPGSGGGGVPSSLRAPRHDPRRPRAAHRGSSEHLCCLFSCFQGFFFCFFPLPPNFSTAVFYFDRPVVAS